MVWYGMVWYGMVWYGMVWYSIVYVAFLSYLKASHIFRTARDHVCSLYMETASLNTIINNCKSTII